MIFSITSALVLIASSEFGSITCLNNPLSRRIIGGHKSEANWPFYVNITWIDSVTGTRTGCGGFLIDELHVITAAHCLYGPPVLYGLSFCLRNFDQKIGKL